MDQQADLADLAVRLITGQLTGSWAPQLNPESRAAEALCQSVIERLRRTAAGSATIETLTQSAGDPSRESDVRAEIVQSLASDPAFDQYIQQLADRIPSDFIETSRSIPGETDDERDGGHPQGWTRSSIDIKKSTLTKSEVAGRDINKNRRIAIGTGGLGLLALLLIGSGYGLYQGKKSTSSDQVGVSTSASPQISTSESLSARQSLAVDILQTIGCRQTGNFGIGSGNSVIAIGECDATASVRIDAFDTDGEASAQFYKLSPCWTLKIDRAFVYVDDSVLSRRDATFARFKAALGNATDLQSGGSSCHFYP